MACNPFATRFIRPGAIPFLFPSGESAAALVEQLRRHDWFGQITGAHGSGKSTLLATLIPELQAAGRDVISITMHQGEHRLPPLARRRLGPETQLVIDGFEQLSWWSRRRTKTLARRHGAGLLVTAHADVGFPAIYRTAPTEALAQAVAGALLANDNRAIAAGDVASAFAATEGNLRETLFRLYDVYQQRKP